MSHKPSARAEMRRWAAIIAWQAERDEALRRWHEEAEERMGLEPHPRSKPLRSSLDTTQHPQ